MTNPDYTRGYNRGRASMNPALDEQRKIAAEAGERARRAENGIVGPCQECARWTRNPGCAWGYCTPAKVAGENWWGEPNQKICTQQGFGCVRFTACQQTPGA